MTPNDRVLLDQLVHETKKEIAPGLPDDEFFELFCAQSLLLNERLEEDEIQSGLIGGDDKSKGGSTDGGIDAIYVLVNQKLIRSPEDAEKEKIGLRQNVEIGVILIQASREEGFSLKRLLRIKQAIENIFSLDRTEFSETYNAALKEAIATFRALHKVFATKHPAVRVEYFYMTRGDTDSISSDVANTKNEIEGQASKILPTIKKCELNFVGARQIFELANRRPVDSYPLPCSVSMCQVDGSAHVALVKLGDYFSFINDEKSGLRTNFFETNVRDYEGDKDVNIAIGETLDKGKEQFWWLNNGITIVSPKVGGHPHELMIDDPQIVNGLQTSQKIFDHFCDHRELVAVDKRELLVRVIEVNDSKTHDEIIKATNSQNRVAPSSLWATKTIHRDIEAFFQNETLFYDRRKNSYRRKGMELRKVVGISELAQSVAAILLQEPDHARARPARYFREEKQHDKVFTEKYPIALYSVCARFGKSVNSFLREAEPNRGTRRNIVFYVMMVAACLAMKATRPSPRRLSQFDINGKLPESVLREALKIVTATYNKHGADDKAAKGTAMVTELKTEIRGRFARKSRNK